MSYKLNDFSSAMDKLADAFQLLRIVNMKSDQELSDFLDSDFRYELPKYTVDISDSSFSVNLHVRNVDEDNLKISLDIQSNAANVTFSSPGPTLADINYAFCVKLPAEMDVKYVRVNSCDLFGEVAISFGLSSGNQLTSYFVGKSPDHLNEIQARYGDIGVNVVCEEYYSHSYRLRFR